MNSNGTVYPSTPAGRSVDRLPSDVKQAWQEVRMAHAVAAYTASEMMCRKILMHLAVGEAGSAPGKKFVQYVEDLEKGGFVTTNLKPVVVLVKDRGNAANHELPASTEEDSLRTLTIRRTSPNGDLRVACHGHTAYHRYLIGRDRLRAETRGHLAKVMTLATG